MRTTFRFILVAITLGCSAATLAQTENSPAASVTSDSIPVESPALSEEQMLEIYGWMAGMRAGLSRLGLTETEMAAFLRGIEAAGAGKNWEVNIATAGPAISQMVQAKFDAYMAAEKAKQMAIAENFWQTLRETPGVTQLPSGLAYKITEPGTGPKPAPVDTVIAHYTGRLIDGTVFDSSQGGGPFETQLNRVIPGWTEGLGLIGAGGKITLYIPASLGYGDAGTDNIPPGATLIFEVELLKVIPAPAP